MQGASAERSVEEERMFGGYGRLYCRGPHDEGELLPEARAAKERLQGFFKQLRADKETPFDCDIFNGMPEPLPPDLMLLLHRLCRVIAAFRGPQLVNDRKQFLVLAEDYSLAQRLLLHLPVTPRQSALSAHAIRTATRIFAKVHEPGYERVIEGLIDFGDKVFTTQNAAEWAEVSYNAAKEHLGQMVQEGIVRTTRPAGERDHGRRIYFAFGGDQTPPFGQQNVFRRLQEIALN